MIDTKFGSLHCMCSKLRANIIDNVDIIIHLYHTIK